MNTILYKLNNYAQFLNFLFVHMYILINKFSPVLVLSRSSWTQQ